MDPTPPPPRAGFVDAGGASLRYELAGDGPRLLVLLHELGGTLESWDGVVPALARGRRVLRYDLRGAGLSEKLRGEARVDAMARDLAGLLDALGLGGRVAVAGAAAGAAIALRFAADHPERVAAVVALAPACGVPLERRAARLEAADRVEAQGLRARVDATMDAAYPAALGRPEPAFGTYRLRWLGNDPGSYAAVHRMLTHVDLDPVLPRVRCPVLALAGTHDPNRSPADIARILSPLADLRVVAIEAGHFMAVQSPAAVAAQVLPFLEETGC